MNETSGSANTNSPRELTFGEKAVGLSFNPSFLPETRRCMSVKENSLRQLTV